MGIWKRLVEQFPDVRQILVSFSCGTGVYESTVEELQRRRPLMGDLQKYA